MDNNRVPEIKLGEPHPDSLTPVKGTAETAIEERFHIAGGPALLDTLDDPSQLLAGAMGRGHDLSVAEVILSEILSTLRQRTHHERGASHNR